MSGRKREFMDCHVLCATIGAHTRTPGCILGGLDMTQEVESDDKPWIVSAMKDDDDKIATHALATPLIARLRGESFIPGVHYALQSEQWMMEAATQLEQLATDVIHMAQVGGMPDSYWLHDSRISRACAVLGITPEQARELDFPDDDD